LSYVIAAYGIVIGSLVVYALRLCNERRKLMGQNEQNPDASERR
jgi:heme exporter protein D